jgi:type I restriction enzyme R subunit
VTSYKPSLTATKGETTGEGLTEKLKQYEIYNKMLAGKTPEVFERDVKKQFIETPGQMKLLIVVDKLLTGFDAPSATYLYIDKQMRDHGLFQAICRVNRLDGEDKDYGYIVDYKDLFKSLEGSIHDYTSQALDGYDKDDVDGLLKDRIPKGREKLEDAREAIKALCEPVEIPKDSLAYMRYFCSHDTANQDALKENEPRRMLLYRLTTSLLRAFANIASELPEAGYSAQEIAQIKQDVDYYRKVCDEIKLSSGDYKDLKMYEPAMRYLIDTYIRAEDSEKLSSFDNMPLLQLIVERGPSALDDLPEGLKKNREVMAETIENNLRRVIIDEHPFSPAYYDRMSELLDTLIKERQSLVKDYKAYLVEVTELVGQVQNPGSKPGGYPESINTPAKRAFYETFAGYSTISNSEQLTNAVDTAIRSTKKDGWRGHKRKEKEILIAIRQSLQNEGLDENLTNTIFEITRKQTKEY